MKDFRYLKPRPFLFVTAGLLVLFYFVKTVVVNVVNGRNIWLFDWHIAGELFGLVSFVFLFMVFVNYWLFRFWPFKVLLSVPILRGQYKGILVSSYHDDAGKNIQRHCTLTIRQTATDLSIECVFTDPDTQAFSSSSQSMVVACDNNEHGVTTVIYTYRNRRNPALIVPYGLNSHDGTATLLRRPETPDVLELTYYNDERDSKGYIRLVRT